MTDFQIAIFLFTHFAEPRSDRYLKELKSYAAYFTPGVPHNNKV